MTEQKLTEKKTHKYSALNYTLYLLSKRDYTEKQLRSKLKLKEYEAVEIDEAITKAQEHNWQSDERFCISFIRYRSQQGIGPRRLTQELKMKGVPEYLIADAMDEAEVEEEIDFYKIAERVFERKRPRVWDIKAKQKMWRFMVSRGFYQDHFSHLMEIDYNDNDDEFDE
ncbi:recombination regulator RecX [uncultured Haemophilus sp.]|uniref:recombination regulator RecX n=1 Tax=uncultured Haemophilus sp. TaxID=237779 RepID=UPI002582CFAB|nr:recombination regulator RecX [uncultured Haemophilus sp.]